MKKFGTKSTFAGGCNKSNCKICRVFFKKDKYAKENYDINTKLLLHFDGEDDTCTSLNSAKAFKLGKKTFTMTYWIKILLWKDTWQIYDYFMISRFLKKR